MPFKPTNATHRHLLQEEKPHTVDIVEGTGVRENAWNFQNVI